MAHLGLVRMEKTCIMQAVAQQTWRATVARFGRSSRHYEAHGHCPNVRVRPCRGGEGRPLHGALPPLMMICGFAAALIAGHPAEARAETPAWTVFHDARIEMHSGLRAGEQEGWLVMRYLAPEIARDGGSKTYEDAAAAMDEICAGAGLATARQNESPVARIVVTLMDRIVEWGRATPEATQFIATYAVTEAGCEWQ